MAATFDPIRALADILTEHGPLHGDDVTQRLRDAGVANPDAVFDEINCPIAQLVDDRWVWLPGVLAGRVFTHRVSADEVADDLLTLTPDLDPITALCDHAQYQRLADGSAVQNVLADFDDELLEEREVLPESLDEGGALLLAPGTLAALGITEGDLVGFRLTAAGLVVESVTAATESAAGARLATPLRADEPVPFNSAVWTACVEDPTLFTEPVAPLSEIVAAHGLAHRGEYLAPGDFDFAHWDFVRGCQRLAVRHHLDADDAFALNTLIQLYHQLALHADDAAETARLIDLVDDIGGALADPVIAELLAVETVSGGHFGAGALGLLAETLESKVPPAARVACRWLRAVALERSGDIAGAERELLTAESMDLDWPLVLLDLAHIASDRGDAEAGLALLHRADASPEQPLLHLLQQYRVQPRTDLGRNEPCWCGSGRKYKKCHLGHEELPLPERVGWLYHKAIQHVLFGDWTELRYDVAFERCRYADPDDDDALPAALADPLVIDAVLFEGGGFEEFLAVRGPLLPDDERTLAEQWLLAERSVFEVEQVRRGQGVTVRDVRTGDRHEVAERAASQQLQTGQLVCARVVPDGAATQFFAAEPVALHERDTLIELLDELPDPAELVAQLSRRFAPPVLTNTEGDPMVVCQAQVRVGDPAGIGAALDAAYDRVEGDGPPRWFEHVVTHGMQRIRAVLTLDGDTLQVETNSEQRMDRVLGVLSGLDPAMQILDDTRDDAALASRLPDAGAGAIDPDDPEIAALLDGFIRDCETRWLDEPIPALAGHTPRQAADDPTRRGDLVKLLDSFPAGAAASGGMDADRLRDALGLR